LRCKSCEHQMLQPIDLQLTQECVTYVQPIHEEATKVFSFNISQELRVDLRDKRRLTYIWRNR
jgi:hypothetical protein